MQKLCFSHSHYDDDDDSSLVKMLVASAFQGFARRLFLASLLISSQSIAKLVNTTIDDGYGDPRTGAQIDYSPPSAWLDGRVECPGCIAKPNSALLYNRTWHDSTVRSTTLLEFSLLKAC